MKQIFLFLMLCMPVFVFCEGLAPDSSMVDSTGTVHYDKLTKCYYRVYDRWESEVEASFTYPQQPYTVVFLFRYHCKPRRAAYCWGVLRVFPRIVPSWRREALPYFPRHWRKLGLPSVPGQPRQIFIQKRLCRWVACALCPQLGWAMRPWIQPIRRWSPFL